MYNVPREWHEEFSSTLMNECFVKVELETDNDTITFTKLELTNFEISQSMNPICSELPTGSLKWSAENSEKQYSYETHLKDKLKRMQKVTASVGITINGEPYYIKAGTFWLDKWEFPNGGMEVHFEARDAFYFLNQRKYIYGLFRPNKISLYDLADEVLTKAAEDFPCVESYDIGTSMRSDYTTAALPVCSYAECLQYIAQAAGNVLIYDRDGTIKFDLSSGSSVASAYQIPRNICFKYPQFTLYPELQKLKCAVYNYTIDELVTDEAYYPNVSGGQIVTAADAVDIMTAAANIGAGDPSGLTPAQEIKADADRDGVITAADASLVLQYTAACGAGEYENTPAGWALFLNIHEGIKEKIYDGYHEIDGDTEIVITHSPSAEVNVVVDDDATLESVDDYTNATSIIVSGDVPNCHVIAYGYPINVNSYEYNRNVGENGEYEYIDNPLVTSPVLGQIATNQPKKFLEYSNGVDCGDFRFDPRLDCGDLVQVLGNGTDIPTVDAIITNIDYKFTGMFRGSCSGRITRFVPVYDETKIAVIELDSSYQPTENVEYFTASDTVFTYLQNNPNGVYAVRYGSELGWHTIPQNSQYGELTSCNSLFRLIIKTPISAITGITAYLANENLISVELPDSLLYIAYGAFARCSALESIDLPNEIRAISDECFRNCTALSEVSMPSNLMSIGKWAFHNCTSLTSIEIPSGVTSINELAFNGCTSIAEIKVSKSQDSIPGAPWGATNATITWTG